MVDVICRTNLDLMINDLPKAVKPYEPIHGVNRFIIKQRLGRIHCMTPILEQCRAVRPKNMRDYPVALRRGWVKCVLDIINDNRSLFKD